MEILVILDNILKYPRAARFLSPVALGGIFCVIRVFVIWFRIDKIMPIEKSAPVIFYLMLLIFVWIFISLFLYPFFYIADRFSEKSNLVIWIVGAISPFLMLSLAFFFASKEAHFTTSFYPYLINLIIGLWAAFSWVRTRGPISPGET